MRALACAGLAYLLSACATASHRDASLLRPRARYVAMGSSYAAGAKIGPLVPGSPERCGRSQNNYAHLLAARLGLDLVDVSCGGATTAHVLGRWLELPAQIDAVTADTRLVTVTIGGNDVNYVRNLMMATCGRTSGMQPSAGRSCPSVVWPGPADYATLERHLREIAREVRRRAPQAMLVFVEYLRVLPEGKGCAAVPLDAAQMVSARSALRRMAKATQRVAQSEGALLLPAGKLSRDHDACAGDPWAAGRPGRPADWHPTAAGHKAIAEALTAHLR